MKLNDYNLPNWYEKKVKRQKALADKRILLLSLDRSVAPPEGGRKNLIAVNADDEIIWIADLPTEQYDSYVEMKYSDGVIRAESSNGFVAEIEPETGAILKTSMLY